MEDNVKEKEKEKEPEKPKISYETLWKLIIRPERDKYQLKDLGPSEFSFIGRKYLRKDYDLISSEGYLMKCSFFEPEISYRPKKIMPVILYLHGNSSSRLEGIGMLKEILKRDINLFVFDFPGCGLSEGEYISLGYHESHDVKVIVDFIEKIPGVGAIGLWGRSMGAATTMIYSHKDNRIKAIVMDSPFADFNILAKELVLKQVKLPNFLIQGALKIVRMTIKKKNDLDIEKLKPIDSAPKTFQPAIFIHANNDELINNHHSTMLLNAYAGKDKDFKKVVGNHNSQRPNFTIKKIMEFFYDYLVNQNIKKDNNKDNEDKDNIFYLDLKAEEEKNNKNDEKEEKETKQNSNIELTEINKKLNKNDFNLNNEEVKKQEESTNNDIKKVEDKNDINDTKEIK